MRLLYKKFLSNAIYIRRFIAGNKRYVAQWIFRLALVVLAVLSGFAWYQRTINIWALKNIGDTFLQKQIGSRQIILGVFFRPSHEVPDAKGKVAVIHFLADGRVEHPMWCHSKRADLDYTSTHAKVQRIHHGKRTANDICSWAGHVAECELQKHAIEEFRIGTTNRIPDTLTVRAEAHPMEKRHDLVVCVAPMYIYTDWEIMLVGIETWLALGATKIIIPVQSASTSTYRILQEYEKRGLVILRHWPKWPVMSDVNPNGLVLSRGIEESHVNCLFYTKPWADLVVFTDIDDMLLPTRLEDVKPGINLEILRNLFAEHPQAGSLLFEHRDTQFSLPATKDQQSLSSFNFDFLLNSKTKMNCNVWRMKTRVVVNASRVDSVNMHETGIHRWPYVQTRVPCRQGHFYHLRHSHSVVSSPAAINMEPLKNLLNSEWSRRLTDVFSNFKEVPLNKSSTESFEDFDRCMSAINEEHWHMKVSRCLTPHVCYSRLKRNVDCVAAKADYSFFRSADGYYITPKNSTTIQSENNCEAPEGHFTEGNHYFSP